MTESERPNREAARALLAPPPVVADAEWRAEAEVMPPFVDKPQPARRKPSGSLDAVWAGIANIAETISKLSATIRADRDHVATLERRISDLEAARQSDLERRLVALEAKGANNGTTP